LNFIFENKQFLKRFIVARKTLMPEIQKELKKNLVNFLTSTPSVNQEYEFKILGETLRKPLRFLCVTFFLYRKVTQRLTQRT